MFNLFKIGVCNSGYTLNSQNTCVDINECQKNSNLCRNGLCKNTDGSYICQCPPGFKVNRHNTECIDVNECVESSSNPCVNGRCVNTDGSFKCVCDQPGTTLDASQRVCIDNRKGLCWTQINNGRCEANLKGETTRAECCASIGKAWGSPCSPCPDKSKPRMCSSYYYMKLT